MAGQFPPPVRRRHLQHLLLVKGEKNHAAYEALDKGKIKGIGWNNHEPKKRRDDWETRNRTQKANYTEAQGSRNRQQRKELKNSFKK